MDFNASDEEVEPEYDYNKSVKSEGARQPLEKNPSITKQSKKVDDRSAMKDLLVKELQKSLSTTALLANRGTMTCPISGTRKKSTNDMDGTKVTFLKSNETCTIEDSSKTGGTDNLWLENQKKKLIAKRKANAVKDTTPQPGDQSNPVKTESNSHKDNETSINSREKNINDAQSNVEEPPKIPGRRACANDNSEDNDEKKKAAIERSLNASNYLLQNWGFKNRNSLKRIKDDLQKLQYGKV